MNLRILSAPDLTRYGEFIEIFKGIERATSQSTEAILDAMTDRDYRTLYCQKDSQEIGVYESCLNVPRSVYKNIPWGTINIENVFNRPASANLS